MVGRSPTRTSSPCRSSSHARITWRFSTPSGLPADAGSSFAGRLRVPSADARTRASRSFTLTMPSMSSATFRPPRPHRLYRGATFLAVPSHAEGFGFPPLEGWPKASRRSARPAARSTRRSATPRYGSPPMTAKGGPRASSTSRPTTRSGDDYVRLGFVGQANSVWKMQPPRMSTSTAPRLHRNLESLLERSERLPTALLISAAFITRNRAHLLARTLPTVLRQVVRSAPSGHCRRRRLVGSTPAVLKRTRDRPHVRCFGGNEVASRGTKCGDPGRAGDVVVFLDDDLLCEPGLLRAHAAAPRGAPTHSSSGPARCRAGPTRDRRVLARGRGRRGARPAESRRHPAGRFRRC